MKKWILLTVLVLVPIAYLSANFWRTTPLSLFPPYRGEKFETWQTENKTFQVRVDAYHEANGGFIPGAYYTFLSAPSGSNDFVELMTFRHDDPIEIRKQQVQFASENVGFVFMGWMFASTSDAGKTWTMWDGCKQAPELEMCNYEGIKAVEISAEGTGTMTINSKLGDGPFLTLRTQDYGRSWHKLYGRRIRWILRADNYLAAPRD